LCKGPVRENEKGKELAGAKIVILGGGFGGISLANALRQRLPKEHRIVVVERSSSFHMGATKTWVMLGDRSARQVSAPIDRLKKRGIDVVRATIKQIDAANRTVETDHGKISGDYLVIALGADYAVESVPGLSEAHSFYTLSGAERMRDAWKEFKGGEVVMLIPRAPFKCPPAPYETAMLMQHDLQKRGLAERSKLSVYTLEGAPMATAGADIGAYIRKSLEERSIGFYPQRRTRLVDAARRTVVFDDGSEARYDFLVAVPPHVAPQCVKESNLTNAAGWIPVDPKTLKLTAPGTTGVYAIGDVTVVPLPGRFKPDMPLVLPKAGVFAQGEALVVASHIAAEVEGKGAGDSYAGKGFCYIEMGGRHAVRGDGSFFEMPHPVMSRAVPDLMQYEQKLAWVENWMKDNLG
jgi:sulfide:quinone oxidoreductase